VTGATLLAVTVDGTGGAQGAFYTIGDPRGAVPAYERYGLNLTGDTSRRRLFLPAAGVYKLAITDTRSLAVGNNRPRPAGAGGAAGGPFAEYYATITVESIPSPMSIPITGGVGRQVGTLATDEVELFTAKMAPGPTTSPWTSRARPPPRSRSPTSASSAGMPTRIQVPRRARPGSRSAGSSPATTRSSWSMRSTTTARAPSRSR